MHLLSSSCSSIKYFYFVIEKDFMSNGVYLKRIKLAHILHTLCCVLLSYFPGRFKIFEVYHHASYPQYKSVGQRRISLHKVVNVRQFYPARCRWIYDLNFLPATPILFWISSVRCRWRHFNTSTTAIGRSEASFRTTCFKGSKTKPVQQLDFRTFSPVHKLHKGVQDEHGGEFGLL
jgi:hypothetical protein